MEIIKQQFMPPYPCINRIVAGTWRVYWSFKKNDFDDYTTKAAAENAIKEYDASFRRRHAMKFQDNDLHIIKCALEIAAKQYGLDARVFSKEFPHLTSNPFTLQAVKAWAIVERIEQGDTP